MYVRAGRPAFARPCVGVQSFYMWLKHLLKNNLKKIYEISKTESQWESKLVSGQTTKRTRLGSTSAADARAQEAAKCENKENYGSVYIFAVHSSFYEYI